MKKFFSLFLMATLVLPLAAQHHQRQPEIRPGRCTTETCPMERECTHAHCQPLRVATPEQVDAILEYVKSVSFDSNKQKAAILCCQLCPILSNDIARISKLFSFDDNRLEFLRSAYLLCPDPQNYFVTFETFTFSSNKNKLIEYMKEDRH